MGRSWGKCAKGCICSILHWSSWMNWIELNRPQFERIMSWIVDLNANIIWNRESSLFWAPRKYESSWIESSQSSCESKWIMNRKSGESVHLWKPLVPLYSNLVSSNTIEWYPASITFYGLSSWLKVVPFLDHTIHHTMICFAPTAHMVQLLDK